MQNDAEKIMELLSKTGKSAANMTNALKEIGDGSMGDGIAQIAAYFMSEGKSVGRLQGAIVVTAVAGIFYMVYRGIKNKKHKLDGEKIISGLQNASAEIAPEETINDKINDEEAKTNEEGI